MESDEITRLANGYLRHWKTDDFPAWKRVTDLIIQRPAEAWPVVLELVRLAPDHAALMYVAAGALEDFVHFNGERFSEAIITAVRQDMKMRHAIVGVWGWDRVHPPLREEVQRLLGPADAMPPKTKPNQARRRRRH